ncbi:hypothetical protein EXIGLDRAFT_844076 [Exidia glandulosa HHB12029]|uniref:Zn(2)-C6 fungal-type domain-containing protein n=1 Tax=Exidia glandulosa HHB12029 TaxID=1314781 RepID=A0A165C9K9_EXIGL|nr:hypothetical protein EXIGLDRAFT_844076 [Exidia glandulosa HHB12029]
MDPNTSPWLHDAELEAEAQSQSRRATTCAECRRLKLRCDKKVPCATCAKRGCASICPDGTLHKGQVIGKRLVLTDARHLYDKIDTMRQRVAALESAIAALQSPSASSSSSLSLHDGQATSAPSKNEDTDAELAQMFGTLAVGPSSFFIGPSASADFFIFTTDKAKASMALTIWKSPWGSAYYAGNFNTPGVRMRDQGSNLVRDAMPSEQIARILVDTYFTNIGWMVGAIYRDDVDRILDTLFPDSSGVPRIEALHVHDLAVLFMVFAFACIFDPDREPNMTSARNMYDLALICISYDDVTMHPTLHGICAVHLVSTFLNLSDSGHTGQCRAYCIHGLAAQMCKTLGLHRDDSHWKLDVKERQRRRQVMWDITTYDASCALVLGRPPNISPRHIDARLPIDIAAFSDEEGLWQHSYGSWINSFTSVCVLKALEDAFSAHGASHDTVMRLDRMIREHPVTEALRMSEPGSQDSTSSDRVLILQRACIMVNYQMLLIYVHRGFFAVAATTRTDMLESKYKDSAIATFRAAMHVTTTVRTLYMQLPFCERIPWLWSSAFSASVILASMVIRSPTCPLSETGWKELCLVVELFESVASKLRIVATIMPSLRKLHQKASASRNTRSVSLDDAELAFIYGRTCLVGKNGRATTMKRTETARPSPPTHGVHAIRPLDVSLSLEQLQREIQPLLDAQPVPANEAAIDGQHLHAGHWSEFMRSIGLEGMG